MHLIGPRVGVLRARIFVFAFAGRFLSVSEEDIGLTGASGSDERLVYSLYFVSTDRHVNFLSRGVKREIELGTLSCVGRNCVEKLHWYRSSVN